MIFYLALQPCETSVERKYDVWLSEVRRLILFRRFQISERNNNSGVLQNKTCADRDLLVRNGPYVDAEPDGDKAHLHSV